MKSTKKLFVVAQSHQQAANWAKVKMINPRNWMFLSKPEQVSDIQKNSVYVVICPFKDVKNAEELSKAIAEREMFRAKADSIQPSEATPYVFKN